MSYTSDELDIIFGEPSTGATLGERVATSTRMFVKSQLQLALLKDHASGRRLTASEVVEAYGWDVFFRVIEDGSFPFLATQNEPASTLKTRREELNLEQFIVARKAGLSVSVVERAENPKLLSRIKDLEYIAQTLALDESILGHITGAHGDQSLGVRLREIASPSDANSFSSADVLALSEAAWVIAKQHHLLSLSPAHPRLARTFIPSWDYRFRAHDRGFELAAMTRSMLEIGPTEPVRSLKTLAEERLGVPVIQQSLSDRFAGATISNRSARGIIINERGMNENVWVRRMTLAHELGHLLWDPEEKLNKLKVDRYADLERATVDFRGSRPNDIVEMRANAFAVSFLAPPDGVREIMSRAAGHIQGVSEVMNVYGISATAAKYHVRNVTNVQVETPARLLPSPSEDWLSRENLTVDFFEPSETPISRRGRFAWFVADAHRLGLISDDTAAMFLKTSADRFCQHANFILEILRPSWRIKEK